jgi:hypothetical protein
MAESSLIDPCQSDWILPRRAFLAGDYEHERKPRRWRIDDAQFHDLVLQLPQGASVARPFGGFEHANAIFGLFSLSKKWAQQLALRCPLLAAHRLEASSTGCLRTQ